MQVHNAFVVVIGLGGVGSHAAAILARSGIGRLRLVDFDQVSTACAGTQIFVFCTSALVLPMLSGSFVLHVPLCFNRCQYPL